MRNEDIEAMLKEDFSRARDSLNTDDFSRRLLRAIAAGRRRKAAIVGLAGALGAGLAGAQFVKMTVAFSDLVPALSSLPRYANGDIAALAPALLAAGALAIAVMATAFVLQGEL